jgi:cytochrome b561
MRYTLPAMALHWLMAMLIFAAFPLGVYAHKLPFSPLKLQLISYHKWLGLTILLLWGGRVLWRLSHKPPPLPILMPNWQRFVAHLAHSLIYLLLVAIPLSGWLMSSAKGIPVVYFGIWKLPMLINKSKELGDLLKEVHEWLNIGLLSLVALHILAALEHHLIEKDITLRRMLPF